MIEAVRRLYGVNHFADDIRRVDAGNLAVRVQKKPVEEDGFGKRLDVVESRDTATR